jgi:hypothetical protein
MMVIHERCTHLYRAAASNHGSCASPESPANTEDKDAGARHRTVPVVSKGEKGKLASAGSVLIACNYVVSA